MQLFTVLLFCIAFAQAAVLVVDPVNGSDSGSGPFKTIKGAVTYNTGSTLDIQLLAGVNSFTSALTLTSATYTSVRIIAADPNNATIRCSGSGYRAFIFTAVPTVELYGLSFTNCADTVTGTGGGAVYGTMGSVFNITACKFYGNNARKGGALSIATNANNNASQLYIHDSAFYNNYASVTSAGALFLTMVPTDIKNTYFTNNAANTIGGAVGIYYDGSTGYNHTIKFTDCLISNNRANTSGAGITTYNLNPLLNLVLVNTEVSNNVLYTSTTCQGAGIYFYTCNQLHVINSTIVNNTAIKAGSINTMGGGIYTAFTKNIGNLIIENSEFSGNSADLSGGVMITNRNSGHTPQHRVSNSVFRNNTGNSNYGAFESVNCSVLIENSLFEYNNVASGGANVVGQSGAIIELRSSIIRNNQNAGYSCQASTTIFYETSVYNNGQDFTCLPTCTIQGTSMNFCNETCAYRDICSTCNGDASLTCAAECDNGSWSSRQSECPVVSTTGSTTWDDNITDTTTTGALGTTGAVDSTTGAATTGSTTELSSTSTASSTSTTSSTTTASVATTSTTISTTSSTSTTTTSASATSTTAAGTTITTSGITSSTTSTTSGSTTSATTSSTTSDTTSSATSGTTSLETTSDTTSTGTTGSTNNQTQVIVIDLETPQNVSISEGVEAVFGGLVNATAYLAVADSSIPDYVDPAVNKPSGASSLGISFFITVMQNGSPLEDFSSSPIYVQIEYSGLTEEDDLWLFDTVTEKWILASSTCQNKKSVREGNTITIPICHLTQFSLFRQPQAGPAEEEVSSGAMLSPLSALVLLAVYLML